MTWAGVTSHSTHRSLEKFPLYPSHPQVSLLNLTYRSISSPGQLSTACQPFIRLSSCRFGQETWLPLETKPGRSISPPISHPPHLSKILFNTTDSSHKAIIYQQRKEFFFIWFFFFRKREKVSLQSYDERSSWRMVYQSELALFATSTSSADISVASRNKNLFLGHTRSTMSSRCSLRQLSSACQVSSTG